MDKSTEKRFVVGYDPYSSEKHGQSHGALVVFKNGKFLYCTTKKWKINLSLWLAKTFGILIVTEK